MPLKEIDWGRLGFILVYILGMCVVVFLPIGLLSYGLSEGLWWWWIPAIPVFLAVVFMLYISCEDN